MERSATPLRPARRPRSAPVPITIAGQTFTITQAAAACGYTLSATSATSASTAGNGTVNVTTSGTNCAWTAASNSSFVSVTSGAAVTGSGTVGYSLTANAAVGFRAGTLTIAGRTFTVTQSGSGPAMSLDKPTLNYGACHRREPASARRLSARPSGSRSPERARSPGPRSPSVPWLTVSPASGTGSATLTLSVAHNRDGSRRRHDRRQRRAVFRRRRPAVGTDHGQPADLHRRYPHRAGGLDGYAARGRDGCRRVDPGDGLGARRRWRDAGAARPVASRRRTGGRDPSASANIVEGARPDVAAGEPDRCLQHRGGWGYLMLTNFLPPRDGPSLRALPTTWTAQTLLGSRTITGANSSASRRSARSTRRARVKWSAARVQQFRLGAVARARRRADRRGGTVNVFIDGVPSGARAAGSARRPDRAVPGGDYPGITTRSACSPSTRRP